MALPMGEALNLVATCALGLEELLEGELHALGTRETERL